MSEPLEIWIDAAIGETREALVRDGKPIALRIARVSDEGRRARWGELYCARVREIDKRRRGAFLDLGLRDQHGFLPLGDDGRARMRKERVTLYDGQGVVVGVTTWTKNYCWQDPRSTRKFAPNSMERLKMRWRERRLFPVAVLSPLTR
jgi:Ribonuclease G/E